MNEARVAGGGGAGFGNGPPWTRCLIPTVSSALRLGLPEQLA